jgi:DNA replication and repair protein RecF
VYVQRLQLRDFRSYTEVELEFGSGLTVVTGENGAGKTNLLEAIGYLSLSRSFRGAPTEALTRLGSDRSVVRADAQVRGRSLLLEAEIVPQGRSRMLVNKQPRRPSSVSDTFAVTVFSPDDLVIIKGGPAERRNVVDQLLSGLHPRNGGLIRDVDKILRQRNALLKQCGGRISSDVGFTLDVWDDKLASVGDALVRARRTLVDELEPFVQSAYNDIADRPNRLSLVYRGSFDVGFLADALAAGRSDDVRRGLSLIGPHRDDIEIGIEGRPSRTHASQGEQRTLALALQLGGHRLLAERLDATPILLLDDVFSELDPIRSDALVRNLPPGQALLATAGVIPPSAQVEDLIEVARGLQSSGSSVRVSVGGGDNPVESVDETAFVVMESRESSDLEVGNGVETAFS